jgi:hypothetical protein
MCYADLVDDIVSMLSCYCCVVPQPTLLAIASTTGWLHIYQPREAGEQAWHRIYSGSHQGSPHMVFSTDGHFLILASGVLCLQLPARGTQDTKPLLPAVSPGCTGRKDWERCGCCWTAYASAGADSGEVLVLSTLTWTTAHQWSLPSCPVGVGLLGPGAELAVFPDTLAPAVRLTLYAAPTRELPVMLQVQRHVLHSCSASLLECIIICQSPKRNTS